jgi:hypothetical protein
LGEAGVRKEELNGSSAIEKGRIGLQLQPCRREHAASNSDSTRLIDEENRLTIDN